MIKYGWDIRYMSIGLLVLSRFSGHDHESVSSSQVFVCDISSDAVSELCDQNFNGSQHASVGNKKSDPQSIFTVSCEVVPQGAAPGAIERHTI
jgi:hypothetical protein